MGFSTNAHTNVEDSMSKLDSTSHVDRADAETDSYMQKCFSFLEQK